MKDARQIFPEGKACSWCEVPHRTLYETIVEAEELLLCAWCATADALQKEQQRKEHPPFISITSGCRGYFACVVAWDTDCGCYLPCESGIGSYATAQEAIPEAKSWAESCELRFEE